MNVYPIGNNLIVKWTLRYSDGTVFPLSLYDYDLSYRTSRGVKVATDTTVEDNVLRWMLKADDQVVSGPYSLELKISFAGNKAADLQYNNAFALTSLSHGNGANVEVCIESNCDMIDLKDAVLQARKAMDLAANAVIDTAKSAADANAAKEAAQKASDNITSLEQAIAELPDGQAVSAKVAEHTTKLTELGVSVTKLQTNKADKTAITDLKREMDVFEDAVRDQVENYKPIIINGNVTNAADEEDITSEDNLLKLKDRSDLNGMGYVILRKNKTFAEQVTKANTIYEIRYEFVLEDEAITIPSNCILKFEGGVLKNANLVLQNTIIENGCFLSSTLSGECNNSVLYLDWFKDGLDSDYSHNIQNLINIAKNQSKILIGNNKYKIENTIILNKCLTLSGFNTTRGYYNMADSVENSILYTISDIKLLQITERSVLLENISFYGNRKNNNNVTLPLVESTKNCSCCSIKNCNFKYAFIGLYLQSGISYIENNNFTICECGCYINAGDNNLIGNYFNTNNTNEEQTEEHYSDINGSGLYIGSYAGNTSIIGGKIEWNTKGIVNTGSRSTGLIINAVQFDWNTAGNIFFLNQSPNPNEYLINNIITGCRFLGTASDFHIYVSYWTYSVITITGCLFVRNNSSAWDWGHDETVGPNYILKVIQNYEYIQYKNKLKINFKGNSKYEASGILSLINTNAKYGDVILNTDFIDTNETLSSVVDYRVLDTPQFTYADTKDGITCSIKKQNGIITIIVSGIATTAINNWVVIPPFTLPKTEILLKAGNDIWNPYIATNNENGLVISLPNDGTFIYYRYTLTDNRFN